MSRLCPPREVVSWPHGQEVYRQDTAMPHVYFPTTSVFGVVILWRRASRSKGRPWAKEGMVGLPVFLGLDFHPFRAVLQVPGEAVQVPATVVLGR